MIKVAIAGATGYTGGELIRILQNHPEADLRWLISTSLAGKSVSSVHRDLLGDCDLKFTDETGEPDVLFMALGHGLSREFLEKNKLPEGCKIIDLGSDFRIDNTFGNHRFVYGMSELFREDIKNTNYVANPGCFATAITLALAPLAHESLLKDGNTHSCNYGFNRSRKKPLGFFSL
jgi:N-acetyl-gamma-glutamyl-phosphate reductase